MSNPRRHHGIAAGNRQPSQRESERPAALGGILLHIPTAILTGDVRKLLADCRTGLRVAWPGRIPYGSENSVEPRAVGSRPGQPMPRGEQATRRLA